MATKKTRSKPQKAAKAVRRPRVAKAVAKPAPGVEIVKRAILDALGRDLADLLTGAPQNAVKHWEVRQEDASSDRMVVRNIPLPADPGPRVSAMSEAMLALSLAIDDMIHVGELETNAIYQILTPETGSDAPKAPTALPQSELAERIARAANAIAENTRMRRDRLSRIEL